MDMSPVTRGEMWRQWIGLALAPIVFAIHEQGNYNLVPWSCITNGRFLVPVFTMICVIAAGYGARVANQVRRREPGSDEATNTVASRAHFLGSLGLGISGLLALILFAQFLADLFIEPCQ
jgi:hypothetical protein